MIPRSGANTTINCLTVPKEKLGDELAAVLAEVGIEQHDGDSFFEFGSV